MKNKTHTCPDCNGDGKETCHNPDHGFISNFLYGDMGRLGCPVCGHDPFHKAINGGLCETCGGSGSVTKEECELFLKEMRYDENIDMFKRK